MAEIFRLQSSFPEYSLNDEQNKDFRRALSDATSYAKGEIRPQNCLICNSSKNKFCKSHSVPARCLRAIAENGEVKTINALIKIPVMDEEKGIKEAGTFKLICKECDDKVFKEYETFERYPDKNPPDKILHEIALKNFLKSYSKKSLEEKAIPNMMSNLQITNSDLLDFILKPGDIDKKDTFKSFCATKKLLNSNTNGYYRIIEYRKLPYTCPFAFQGDISLITGFDDEIINNLYNLDKKNKLQNIHICVFPEKSYTYIIAFYSKYFDRYAQFAKHYHSLNEEERLRLLLFIILKYSEDFFYSPSIQDVLENQNVSDAATATTILYDVNEGKNEEIKKSIQEFDLKNYKNIPNILSQEYELKNPHPTPNQIQKLLISNL